MQFKLRNKILFPVIGILLLGQTILGIGTFIGSQNSSIDLLRESSSNLTRIISANIDQWLSARETQLNTWSKSSRFITATKDTFIGKSARRSSKQALDKNLESYPMYLDISIADLNGKVIVSTNKALLDKTVNDKEFFSTISNGGDFHQSTIQRSEAGIPVFKMSAPIKEKTELKGVLIATVNFSSFDKSTLNIPGVKASNDIFILLKNGLFIANKDPELIMKTETQDMAYVKKAIALEKGELEFESKGVTQFASFDKLGGRDWIVGVSVNKDLILASAKTNTNNIIILAIIMVILIILVLVWVAQSQVEKPIQELIKTTKSICDGELNTEIDTKRKDEFGILATDFETMRDAIREKIEEIEDYNRNLESKVQERTKQIATILDNVQHGFLLVNYELEIEDGYSHSCQELLGTEKLTSKKLPEILCLDSRNGENYEVLVQQVLDEPMFAQLTIEQLPCRFKVGDKHLLLEPTLVEADEFNPIRLLYSITDISTLVKQEEENAFKSSLISILEKIDAFRAFLSTTTKDLGAFINHQDAPDSEVRALLHTAKGTAGLFEMHDFAHNIHHIESKKDITSSDLTEVNDYLKTFVEDNSKVLKVNFEDLDTRKFEFSESVMHEMKDLIKSTFHKFKDERLEKSWNLLLSKLTEVKFGPYLKGLEDYVHKTAEKLGKKVRFACYGIDMTGPSDFVPDFCSVIVHAVRNSIDHGIEPLSQRNGKPQEGLIELEIKRYPSGRMTIAFFDDGNGLDVQKIRAKAIEKGIIDNEKAHKMTEEEMCHLIFSNSFSTQETVSQLSGRGVGMSALKSFVEEKGGVVKINNKPGVGLTLVFDFPELCPKVSLEDSETEITTTSLAS